jgi:hypothetical protein
MGGLIKEITYFLSSGVAAWFNFKAGRVQESVLGFVGYPGLFACVLPLSRLHVGCFPRCFHLRDWGWRLLYAV